MTTTDLVIGFPFYSLGKADKTGARTAAQNMKAAGDLLFGPPQEDTPAGCRTIRSAVKLLHERGIRASVDVDAGATLLSLSRSSMAARFLDTGAKHLWFVDDDIYTPSETVLAMLSADADVVFVPYRQRYAPYPFVVRFRTGETVHNAPMRHMPCKCSVRAHLGAARPEYRRFLEVESGGLGCALIARRVIEKLFDVHRELQWFDADGKRQCWIFREELHEDPPNDRGLADELDPARRRHPVGEDIAFMQRACAAGFTVEAMIDAEIIHGGVRSDLGRSMDESRADTQPTHEDART